MLKFIRFKKPNLPDFLPLHLEIEVLYYSLKCAVGSYLLSEHTHTQANSNTSMLVQQYQDVRLFCWFHTCFSSIVTIPKALYKGLLFALSFTNQLWLPSGLAEREFKVKYREFKVKYIAQGHNGQGCSRH